MGRGHEGVLTEEDGRFARPAAAVVSAVAMRPALKATVMRVDVVGGEGGNGAGGIAVAGVKVSCGGSPRTVSRQLSGRCAIVRMVATAGS